MKNNFKLLTKLFSLILMLSLFGCEKDLYDDALTPKKELSVKHVSLKDLSRTENTDLFKKVDQVNLKRKNALGKIVYDSINHFYFDDENGKIIETADGYKSYTFPIIREVNDGKIENLLFSKNQNGSYDTYTVKYDFTEEELKNFSQEQIDQQAVTYQRFGDDIVCIDSMSWVSYPIDNGDLTGNFGYTGHWVVTSSVCEHLQPISNSSGGLGSTGWAGGGFTASNPTNQTGGIHTTPVTTPGMAFVQSFGISQETILGLPREVQQSIFDYLTIHHFDNITKARVKWFLLHYVNFYGLETLPIDSQVSIFNYFALNNYSTVCATQVNEMIAVCVQNGGSFVFDNSINASNSEVFSTVAEFQNYIDNLQNQSISALGVTNQTNPSMKTAHGTFSLPMFCEINENFDQNIKTTSQAWNLNSVTFNLSGLTLGTSWTQDPPDNPIVFIGDIAIIHIRAYLHLNAFIGGYGNFYTHSLEILIHINTTTGELIFGELIKH
jgi:hypothetical protein